MMTVGSSGCFGTDELPPVDYSDGFFADFDRMVQEATAVEAPAEQAKQLRFGFASFRDDGPGPQEVVVTGHIWEKVSTFLQVGLRTADVMGEVDGAEQNRVDMYLEAAEVIRRSDTAAITAWNDRVVEMERPEERLELAGEHGRATLALVLAESEHAVVQVWVESGEWIEGHWERSDGYYEDVWVPGYWESVWQDGSCWDEYVGTDCETYWVDEACWEEWVDLGYWETSCDEYDAWGDCVSWSEYWVSDGYWEVVCDPGYWYEDCWDIYEEVCTEGQWVDVWIEGYYTQGPWIPGETYWVEGYWSDTSSYQPMVLLEQEAEILAEGVSIAVDLGSEILGEDCHSDLDAALADSSGEPAEQAGERLRQALLGCLDID